MNFKKDKVFTAVIAVFALAFVAGVGFCVKEFISNSQTGTAIAKAGTALARLENRGDAPALTEKNVETEKRNEERLKKAKEKKILRLSGAGADELAPSPTIGDSTGFLSQLLGIVNARADQVRREKIALGDDAKFFGFSRYLQNNQTQTVSADVLPLLDSEQKALSVLGEKLVAARAKSEEALRANGLLAADKRLPMLLKKVRREASELPQKGGVQSVVAQKDELTVRTTEFTDSTGFCQLVTTENTRGRPFISLRRGGRTDAKAFQLAFVAPTSVLRNFISEFSEQGKYPIYVRDISVVPAVAADVDAARLAASPESAAAVPAEAENAGASSDSAGFDIFGVGSSSDASSDAPAAAPAAPAVPVKSAVQPELLSEFLVTLEYVRPIDEPPAPAEENEEE